MPRFGAHMSVAGGLEQALFRGDSIGCDTIQLFLRAPTRWKAPPLDDQQIAAFREARAATGIHPVIVHGSYLVNLASPDEALWRRSLDTLVDDLRRCQLLGVERYVLHPGAHTGSGEDAGLARVAQALQEALAEAGESVRILLENTAGQGTTLGYQLEHLAIIRDGAANPEGLGICIDTAHAVAAGYDLAHADAYAGFWGEVRALFGTARVGCLHLNDSLREESSRVDRHTHIGEGYVGLEGFRRLVNDAALQDLPMILETPKDEDMLEDIRNLALLRSLRDGAAQGHRKGGGTVGHEQRRRGQ